jgi:hypothetical protein
LSIAYDNYFADVARAWYGDDAITTVFFLNTSRGDCLLALEALNCPFVVTSDDKEVLRRLKEHPLLRSKVFSTRGDFRSVFNLAILDSIRRLREAGHGTIAAEIEGKLEPANAIRPPDDMRFTSFAPCRPNYYSMIQLLCPGRANNIPVENVKPSERVVHLVQSVQDLMGLEHELSQFEISGKSFAGFRPPLILVAPYLGSGMANQFARSGTKGLSAAMQKMVRGFAAASRHEQNSTNYNVEFPTQSPATESPEGLIGAVGMAAKRVSFLDDIGYLHCSFQSSPYIRLPAKGRSLNEQLSAFAPQNYARRKNDKKVLGLINRFGAVAAAQFPPGVESFIDGYVDQMVAISDLPVEWFHVSGVPLAFLCDVCRMPETTPSSLMAQYVSNCEVSFVIGADILEHTLAICGSTEDPALAPGAHILESLTADIPTFKVMRCSSLASFAEMVSTHRPQLLLIDTHGQYNSEAVGTTFMMGTDAVNGQDIIRLGLAAPLVILSCCSSAPLYGHPNTIAQAFFEAGARAVLSTFLPINAQLAATLNARLVRNLSYACRNPVHPNWLAFVSHNLRTALFDDCLARLLLNGRRDWQTDEAEHVAARSEWQMKTVCRGTRADAFRECASAVAKTFPPSLIKEAARILAAQDTVPEYLYYTHLGRADLVPFSSWLAEHHDPTFADGGLNRIETIGRKTTS